MILYKNVVPAVFVKRINRFTAEVMIGDAREIVHMKNTGRLETLLVPKAKVTLQRADNPARTTKYDLISVYASELGWVNIDSLAPNALMRQYLESQYDMVKPEYVYGDSRFDFYMERDGEKYLAEVKGCTLTYDPKQGIGYFPDAPSVRAVKHLNGLAKAAGEGFQCSVDFVIQMNGIRQVLPHDRLQPEFGIALKMASRAGVKIFYHLCDVKEDRISMISTEEA